VHSDEFTPLTFRQKIMAGLRLCAYSGLGGILFFWQFDIDGKSMLLLDALVLYSIGHAKNIVIVLAMGLMLYGAVYPWLVKKHRPVGLSYLVFRILKVLGLLIALCYVLHIGPDWLYQKDMLPFLFEKLVLSLAIIVPCGALALGLLIGFGFLELLGVLMRPVMRPLFNTPGKSAIDAVASFAGSYSVGMLITDRLYRQKIYSLKEATIIATGFSTVSMPFMVVVARTLELMPYWQLFFWTTFAVTFLVTAITAKLYPIKQLDNTAQAEEQLSANQSRIILAIKTGITQAHLAPKLHKVLVANFMDGLRMATAILPSILSVGLVGLLLAKYTPVFKVLGLLFWPVFWLFGVEQSFQVSEAVASGFAEMFLPALLLKDFDITARFVAAVTSISGVLFLSGSIPCIFATSIPVKFKDILLIWVVRTYCSVLLALLVTRCVF